MKHNIFRQKSVERIASPEQLNDYIKVTNPGMWLSILAVMLFITAVVIWGAMGRIDTVLEVKGYSDGKYIYCYISEQEVEGMTAGMDIRMVDVKGEVTEVAELPESYEDASKRLGDASIAQGIGFTEKDWKYRVVIQTEGVRTGIVKTSIITESVSPVSYIFN